MDESESRQPSSFPPLHDYSLLSITVRKLLQGCNNAARIYTAFLPTLRMDHCRTLMSFIQLFKSLTTSPSVSKGTGSIPEPNLHAPAQGAAMELPTSRNRSMILPFPLLYISFCNWVVRICLAGGNFLRRNRIVMAA